MSTVTTHLNLVKPATPEQFSLATFNNNLDLIDASFNTIRKYAYGDRVMSFGQTAFGWGGGSDWDAGVLTPNTDPQASSQISSPVPVFAVQGTQGQIKIVEPGLYVAQWLVFPTTNPGDSGYKILMAGAPVVWPGTPAGGHTILGMTQRNNTAPFWESEVKTEPFRVPVADLQIRFQGKQANGTTNAAIIRLIQVGKI